MGLIWQSWADPISQRRRLNAVSLDNKHAFQQPRSSPGGVFLHAPPPPPLRSNSGNLWVFGTMDLCNFPIKYGYDEKRGSYVRIRRCLVPPNPPIRLILLMSLTHCWADTATLQPNFRSVYPLIRNSGNGCPFVPTPDPSPKH